MPRKLHWKQKVALEKKKAAAALLPPRDPPKRRNHPPKGRKATRPTLKREMSQKELFDHIMSDTICKLDNNYQIPGEYVEEFTDPAKGKGLKAKMKFPKGNFIVEYKGRWMSRTEAIELEEEREANGEQHVYVFLCSYATLNYGVDGKGDENIARLINHSRIDDNVFGKVIADSKGNKRLCLFAKRDINAGEELLIDYSDRRPETIEHNPWLAE